RLIEDRREVGPLLLVAPLQIGHGDRDRSQRILDLVRHLARHLPPSRLPLADDELSPVRTQVLSHAIESLGEDLNLAHAPKLEGFVPLAPGEELTLPHGPRREGSAPRPPCERPGKRREARHGPRELRRPEDAERDRE